MPEILLVGDSTSGKTCLLTRYCEGEFNEQYLTTIGVDFKIKVVKEEGRRLKVHLWDTAGQEKFRSITVAYYRGATAIIIAFDLTTLDSFDHVNFWIGESKRLGTPGIPLAVVACKSDLADQRVVSRQTAEALAEREGAGYFETSALSGEGIDALFNWLIAAMKDNVLANVAAEQEEQVARLEPEKKSGCC